MFYEEACADIKAIEWEYSSIPGDPDPDPDLKLVVPQCEEEEECKQTFSK